MLLSFLRYHVVEVVVPVDYLLPSSTCLAERMIGSLQVYLKYITSGNTIPFSNGRRMIVGITGTNYLDTAAVGAGIARNL